MVSVTFPFPYAMIFLFDGFTYYFHNLLPKFNLHHHSLLQGAIPVRLNISTQWWWVYGPHINEYHYIYISDLEVIVCIENHCTFHSNLTKLPPFNVLS